MNVRRTSKLSQAPTTDITGCNGIIHVIEAFDAATPRAEYEEKVMKTLDLATIGLLIVGGLNWGLVGVFDWDLVAFLFGPGSMLSRLVYVAVGMSAIWQVGRLFSGRYGLGGALHTA